MSLSFWTTAMVPVSYFPWQIAHQIRRNQVIFSRATALSGQTWTRVKSDSVVVHSSTDHKAQLSSDRPSPWKMWLLGVTMSTVLSFFSSKWGPLLKIKNEVEEVVRKAEHVTETVEKVAEGVDKVAEEIKPDLPEGGKLREAVVAVDEVAKTTANDAELVEDVIKKVEEVEKHVDSFMAAANDPNPTSSSAQGD